MSIFDPTNGERAIRAGNTFDFYAAEQRGMDAEDIKHPEDRYVFTVDLISDLCHLLHSIDPDADIEAALASALNHFRCEQVSNDCLTVED